MNPDNPILSVDIYTALIGYRKIFCVVCGAPVMADKHVASTICEKCLPSFGKIQGN